MWRKKVKDTNTRTRNGCKSKKPNEEVQKGQEGRDKSRRGEGEREAETDRRTE